MGHCFAIYQIVQYPGVNFPRYWINCLSFAKSNIGRFTSHSSRNGMASHCADVGMSDNKITPTSIEIRCIQNYIRPVNLVKREQRQHNSSECELVDGHCY